MGIEIPFFKAVAVVASARYKPSRLLAITRIGECAHSAALRRTAPNPNQYARCSAQPAALILAPLTDLLP